MRVVQLIRSGHGQARLHCGVQVVVRRVFVCSAFLCVAVNNTVTFGALFLGKVSVE